MTHNKVTSDYNIVSILECVDENPLEVESSDSDNEIGHNQESDSRSGSQTVNKVPVVTGLHDVKCK
jgi:hypothetical protein